MKLNGRIFYGVEHNTPAYRFPHVNNIIVSFNMTIGTTTRMISHWERIKKILDRSSLLNYNILEVRD